LQACDTALTDCDTANKSKQAVIDQQSLVLQQQDKVITDYEKANKSILNSPILWFFVGAAVSGVAVGVLHK
jgi:hypothetical protein